MKKRMNSEYWWKQFLRIQQAQECFEPNSAEYLELNRVGWEIILKYIDKLWEGK